MPKFLPAVVLALLPLSASAMDLPRTPAPEGARVYFIEPADGATVPARFTVRFGLGGMGVAPAGIEMKGTGHHHLLVNVDQLPDPDQPIPNDERHRHFGMGQTEVEIELEPGEHTLQLLLGDHLHRPHQPPVVSEAIRVVVEGG